MKKWRDRQRIKTAKFLVAAAVAGLVKFRGLEVCQEGDKDVAGNAAAPLFT
jgi:hypothetical protein